MGTHYHDSFLSREERDPRRDKRKCVKYTKGSEHCGIYNEKCHGSQHCPYYEERTDNKQDQKRSVDDSVPQKNIEKSSPKVFMLEMIRKQNAKANKTGKKCK